MTQKQDEIEQKRRAHAEAFDGALAAIASELTAVEREEVLHFVEFNEFGLAFETLLGIYAETRKSVSPEALDQMQILARRLNRDWGKCREVQHLSR